MRLRVVLLSLWMPLAGYAADTPHTFQDPALQARYDTLLAELRCLVCQNQSLADSHADLAQDLRNEVYRMVQDGQTRDDILAFMVQRYGDFVLYRPPFKALTWLLWTAPLLLLTVMAITWRRLTRRTSPDVPLSDDEQQRLATLLKSRGNQPASPGARD